jgi:hypothetical protein
MASSFKKIIWTEHSKIKMKQYGLSKIKILNLLHRPERAEQGIVPGTIALMKTNKLFSNDSFKKNLRLQLKVKTKFTPFRQKKSPGEVWLMYKDIRNQRKIISAWRYPGITKPGEQIPIPQDIRNYIENSKDFN